MPKANVDLTPILTNLLDKKYTTFIRYPLVRLEVKMKINALKFNILLYLFRIFYKEKFSTGCFII